MPFRFRSEIVPRRDETPGLNSKHHFDIGLHMWSTCGLAKFSNLRQLSFQFLDDQPTDCLVLLGVDSDWVAFDRALIGWINLLFLDPVTKFSILCPSDLLQEHAFRLDNSTLLVLILVPVDQVLICFAATV